MDKWIIAITGKGGTGKTALTTLITKVLIQHQKKLLIVDADPAMGLAHVLGIQASRTLEDLRLEIIKVGGRGIEDEKQDLIVSLDYKIMELLIERPGFAALIMGQPRTAGCFCPANTLLRDAITPLIKSFDFILIDCEAGLEQINRKVVQTINLLLIVSDPTVRGLETAAAIHKMAQKFTQASHIGLILNKVSNPTEIDTMRKKTALDIIGTISFDPQIAEFDLIGRSLLDLPKDSESVKAVEQILNVLNILKKT
ncbi:MAG TPA: AAA family ATPase [Candidatus Deferrimicrobium sp.]|nr:AAA family ATPase [Candidatus Deferrimicrobium sp.]